MHFDARGLAGETKAVKRVGDYKIVRKLGEGGMGSVFLARDRGGQPVVLKTPHRPTAELVAHMDDEARTGFRLRHRHIVRTLDYFTFEERPVLVIEWIDGASLKELRDEQGRLPPAMVARIGEQVSDALSTIHHLRDDNTGADLRMLHRDVTPGNIVLSRDGDAKLIDLGIARSVESQSQKTSAGMLRGTFRYLSPDLFAGAPYSWMTDLWALGVTLFEAALGRRAIEGENAKVFKAVADGQLTALRPGEELHPMLRFLFDGLLNPDSTKRRFKDPEEVLHAFRVLRARLGDGESEARALMARVPDRTAAPAAPPPAPPAGASRSAVPTVQAASLRAGVAPAPATAVLPTLDRVLLEGHTLSGSAGRTTETPVPPPTVRHPPVPSSSSSAGARRALAVPPASPAVLPAVRPATPPPPSSEDAEPTHAGVAMPVAAPAPSVPPASPAVLPAVRPATPPPPSSEDAEPTHAGVAMPVAEPAPSVPPAPSAFLSAVCPATLPPPSSEEAEPTHAGVAMPVAAPAPSVPLAPTSADTSLTLPPFARPRAPASSDAEPMRVIASAPVRESTQRARTLASHLAVEGAAIPETGDDPLTARPTFVSWREGSRAGDRAAAVEPAADGDDGTRSADDDG